MIDYRLYSNFSVSQWNTKLISFTWYVKVNSIHFLTNYLSSQVFYHNNDKVNAIFNLYSQKFFKIWNFSKSENYMKGNECQYFLISYFSRYKKCCVIDDKNVISFFEKNNRKRFIFVTFKEFDIKVSWFSMIKALSLKRMILF